MKRCDLCEYEFENSYLESNGIEICDKCGKSIEEESEKKCEKMDEYRLKEVVYHLHRLLKINRLNEFIRKHTAFSSISEMLIEIRKI